MGLDIARHNVCMIDDCDLYLTFGKFITLHVLCLCVRVGLCVCARANIRVCVLMDESAVVMCCCLKDRVGLG